MLKDDFALLNLSFFPRVPIILNIFHDNIKAKVDELNGCKSGFDNKGERSKLEAFEHD